MALDPYDRRRTTRSHSGIAIDIREKLENDPAWQHFTPDGRWICPYCLSAVRSVASGRSGLVRAIERHLTARCGSFKDGRGTYQSEEAINNQLHYETVAAQATQDPAWQVFDHEGYWYSPASLQRVTSVRIQNGRLDGFTIKRMAAVVAQDANFQAGRLHAVDVVQRVRDEAMRAGKLASDISKLLSHKIWRYRDSAGCWVCPYCLEHVAGIQVSDEREWLSKVPDMARHLLGPCTGFSPQSQVMHSEESVQQAALLPPPPGLSPYRVAARQPPPWMRFPWRCQLLVKTISSSRPRRRPV